MSWLKRTIRSVQDAVSSGGRGSGLDVPAVTLDVETRRAQLLKLESVLDRLVEVMKANEERMSNPGWRERMAEYRRLSGQAYTLRRGSFDRAQLLDLAFEIRPVFTGSDLPPDVQPVEPLQAELMEAAKALQDLLPSETAGTG